jgi:hypothetical protein
VNTEVSPVGNLSWLTLFKIQTVMIRYSFTKIHEGRRWTRLHNTQQNRDTHSWYDTLLKPAALHDVKLFHNWTQMFPTAFNAPAKKNLY